MIARSSYQNRHIQYVAISWDSSSSIARLESHVKPNGIMSPSQNTRINIHHFMAISCFILLCGSLMIAYTRKMNDSYEIDYNKSFQFSLKRYGYSSLSYTTDRKSRTLRYAIFDDHDAIIEPYACMELHIGPNYNHYDIYNFSLCDMNAASCFTGVYSNKSTLADESDENLKMISIPCAPYDVYTFNVSILGEGKYQQLFSSTAICMYVRREIRSLIDSDLNATMNAMAELWRTSESDGQAIYGEDYHDIEYFTAIHEFHSAQQDSDHMHDGIGTITNLY